jgi:hypothetical protein
MKALWSKIVIFFSILALMTMACSLSGLPAGSGTSELRVVNVSPGSGRSPFTMMVSYIWVLGDPGFAITCRFPNSLGDEVSLMMALNQKTESISYEFYVEKAGSYTVECDDHRNHSASALFTVIANDAPPANPAPPADPVNPGSFKIPKPGDFNSAGMWMVFDEGNSDVPGYAVPRQCLPGVNYSQAGGTSHFDIDPAGNMTGDCKLEYNEGKMRLTGSMTGAWDGQKDEITFHLETLTEIDAVTNGKTGMSSNKTIYEGTAHFNSDVQASGTANWHTECVTSDPAVIQCSSDKGSATLSANGSVPFVINFNAK